MVFRSKHWDWGQVLALEDLRLEFAFNYDQFEPADLGRCGEPYTAFAACNVTLGLFGNGITGRGLAGTIRPPDPWNSFRGICLCNLFLI